MASRAGDNSNWHDHLEQSGADCQLLTFVNKAREWWLETTDVVFLNSPWLQRGTGRAFRCLWILYHAVSWTVVFCRQKFVIYLSSSELISVWWSSVLGLICFVGMILTFAKVLLVSLTTTRDSFSISLFLCIGSLFSYECWVDIKAEPLDLWVAASPNTSMTSLIGYTLPILCHCNVHPVVLLLLFAYTLVTLVYTLQDSRDAGFDTLSLLHIIGFQFCMCCSFTFDFTNRVKAVANSMLHNADSCDPLDSPVAGRSARGFCWLAGVNNWIIVGFICLAQLDLGLDPSWMFGLDTISLSLPWIVFLCARLWKCTSFQSDLALVFFCNAPAAWAMIRRSLQDAFMPHSSFETSTRIMVFIFTTSIACTSHVFATQAAIQAGCFPSICLSTTLLMTVLFAATTLLKCDFCWSIVWDFSFELAPLLSLVARLL